MVIKFNWELFLIEQSLTQKDLCEKIDRSIATINPYVKSNYISVKMKGHIENVLNIDLNKYLIME
jgi:transcriptional regulator with XRE-family HTH domain